MLFTEYETFKMKDSKTLQEMITRLTTFVNELSLLRTTLTIKEKVYKVLRVFPKENWGVKVIAIREAKDLTTMTLDELVGNLETYEYDHP